MLLHVVRPNASSLCCFIGGARVSLSPFGHSLLSCSIALKCFRSLVEDVLMHVLNDLKKFKQT